MTFVIQLATVALAVTGVNAIRPMVTYRALDLGADPLQIGLLAAGFSIAPALFAVAVGRAIDRRGEVWFIRAALVAMTVGAALAATAGSLPFLALSHGITGAGHVTNLIAGQALVANRGTRDRRDHRYGYYSTMASLGQLMGPLLGTALVGEGTSVDLPVTAASNAQAPAFIAAAVLTAGAFALAFFLPTRRPAQRSATEPAGVERRGLVSSARGVLGRPGMPFAMIVSMIVVSTIDVLVAYLPLYGEARGLAVATVGILLAIRAGSSMISRLLMGYLIARLGRNLLLAFSMGSATAGLVALPLVDSPVALGALMVLIGLGLGIGQPMTMAWVANRSPRAERGIALGVRLTGNRVALIVVPVAVGAVAGVGGVSVIFWVMALLLGSGAAIGFVAPLDTRPPPVPSSTEGGDVAG